MAKNRRSDDLAGENGQVQKKRPGRPKGSKRTDRQRVIWYVDTATLERIDRLCRPRKQGFTVDLNRFLSKALDHNKGA